MLKWYVKDAPVSRKIQLGFGLLVALVGSGAGFSAFTVQQTELEVGHYRESAKANVAAEQAVGEFTQMRVAARDYADAIAAGDSAGASRHMQELRHLRDQVLEELTQLSEEVDDQSIRSQVASLPEQVQLYEQLTEDGTPEALRRRGELAESLTHDVNELAEVFTARRDEIGPVMQGRLDQMAIVALALLVMTLGLGGLLAVVLSNIIGRPIKSTTEAMNQLAAGDLNIDTGDSDRKDDVGALLRSLEVFRSNAEAKVELDKKNVEAAGYLSAISRVQAVIEFSMDGKILTANENFCTALGYSLDEIRGQHHSMFVDNNYRQSPDYRLFWDKLGRGVADEGKYLRMGKGGKVIWIQATYNPIADASGKPYKVVKFATDITEAELGAQEQEALLNSIGKSQAVISFKPDGTILDANDNFLAALGYSKQEIVGKHHSMFVDAEFRASGDYRAFWDQLNRGDFSAGKFKRIARGGKEIWIQASYNPLVNRQG